MPSSLAVVAQGCEPRFSSLSLVIKRRWYPRYSPPALIQYPRRAVSPAPSPARIPTTTGAGTCMTPLKGPITLAIKTRLSTCVASDRKPCLSSNTWDCPSLERTMDEFTKGRSAVRVKILATVGRRQELARLLTEQVTRCCTRYFKGT